MPLIGVDTEQKDNLVKVKSSFVYNSEIINAEEANEIERELFNKKENRKRRLKKFVTLQWFK